MIKKILAIINIALVTAAVFIGVKLFYGVVTSPLEEEMLLAELTTRTDSRESLRATRGTGTESDLDYSRYQAIAERDLFRTKTAETRAPDVVETDIEDLKKTGLQLRLWGTITGDDGGVAYAVIEDTSRRRQPQHLYREGDNIGDAVIKKIFRERVVLTVGGSDEVLEMEEMLDHARAGQTDPQTGHARAPRLESGPGQEFSIDRDRVEEALADVGNLMRQVRVRPYFEDGNPQGILLSGVRRNSIFEDMGLQSGDVIKGINGNPIRSVDDAMELYQGLRSERDVQVQIQRDGSIQTISYRIQ